MKIKIFGLFLALSTLTYGQKTDNHSTSHFPEISVPVSLSCTEVLKNQSDVLDFLEETYKENGQFGFTFLEVISSQTGKHYRFAQTFDNIPLYHAEIKVNTDMEGNVTSIFSGFIDAETKYVTWTEMDASVLKNEDVDIVHGIEKIWLHADGELIPAYNYNYTDSKGYNFEKIYHMNGDLHYDFETTKHFSDVDTTAKAFVFNPNPITSANTVYGIPYVNNSDQASSVLDAERKNVDIKVTYDNGTFYLENDYVKVVEISLPDVPPVTSNSPEFFYDRSQSGFEDVNVLYHITTLQEYIRFLGFTNLVNYQIQVDCHGFSGDDNSAFNTNTNPPNIIFGEGGVDDAEDADVITHEYTHGIIHSATPHTSFGTERKAMDEALGDYVAASYSKAVTAYHHDRVFNWDGHNEYWDGRVVNSTLMWPNGLQFNLYLDAPMFSSALMRIERNIGRDITHQVAFEAWYNFSAGMTMAQGAQLMIQADSQLTNGANYGVICHTFLDKGMVNSCAVSKPPGMVSIEDPEKAPSFRVLNSMNFANGTGPLQIESEELFEIQIINLAGQIMYQNQQLNQVHTVEQNILPAGAYLVKIIYPNFVETIKVIRF